MTLPTFTTKDHYFLHTTVLPTSLDAPRNAHLEPHHKDKESNDRRERVKAREKEPPNLIHQP
jgi:hypothetical protein